VGKAGPFPRFNAPDRGLAASLGATVLLAAVFGVCAALTPPRSAALSIELLSVPRTWVPIETAPAAAPTVRHRARWSDGVDSVADEAGWPMKGEQGEAGAPDAAPSERGRIEVRGHDADLIPRAPDPIVAPAQVGILGVLSRFEAHLSPVPAPYGTDRAAGASAIDAYGDPLAALAGFGRGFGGFDMIGTGRGGCPAGDARCAAGTVGRGGFFAAGGFGAGCDFRTCSLHALFGTGGRLSLSAGERFPSRRSASRANAVPNVRSIVTGSIRGLTDQQVARVVARHRAELRFCLDSPAANGEAGGANVRVVVQPSGAVQSSAVVDHASVDAAAARCVAGAVRRWTFPQAAMPTVIDLPLHVVSAG